QDPRSSVVALLGRALAALPQAVRDGAAAAGRKIRLRADAGYFAGDLARAAEWPQDTVLLIRRVRLDPEQVSADPRSRRRRTLHPGQRALPIPELEAEPAIYAYSFILTNADVSTPAKAAACEH